VLTTPLPPELNEAMLRAFYGEEEYAARVNGHTPKADDAPALDIVNWADLFAGIQHEDPIVEGIAFRGRWTSFAAPAKAGKSTLLLAVATAVARGRSPFDELRCEPANVLYIDAEMGRVDMHERLEELELTPEDLTHLHYVDVVPKLDTVEGAARLTGAAEALSAALVVIDGINGTVSGAEKDDTPWRDLYELAIAPLKQAGVAILTADNLGKDKTLGPRGHSVKMDKADAVIEIIRTDDGIKLKTTHRRTAAYPLELDLRLVGLDGEGAEPLHYRHTASAWPAGTAAKAAELDELGVPLDASRRQARDLMKAAGRAPGNNQILGKALRFRTLKSVDNLGINGPGPPLRTDSGPTVGTSDKNIF
jgi:KaiC/GvpD/RAD55 family RecA-like ATPase